MQNATKMMLVPQEMLQRLQNRSLTGLDKAMEEILYNKNLGEREKWKLYQQSLQQHLHRVEESEKPLKITLQEEEPESISRNINAYDSDERQNVNFTQRIIKILQVSLSRHLFGKAQHILRLLEETQRVKWNGIGELLVNGVLVKDSNVAELLANAVRSSNNVKPVGWQAFVDVIDECKVPDELLGKNLLRARKRRTTATNVPWERFTL
jgi:hypothetical protein